MLPNTNAVIHLVEEFQALFLNLLGGKGEESWLEILVRIPRVPNRDHSHPFNHTSKADV